MIDWKKYYCAHGRPPPHGTREAHEFLVSMAGDILGSWLPIEAEPIEQWLEAELERPPGQWGGCSGCGSKEHNRRTCPIAIPTIDVKARIEEADRKVKPCGCWSSANAAHLCEKHR